MRTQSHLGSDTAEAKLIALASPRTANFLANPPKGNITLSFSVSCPGMGTFLARGRHRSSQETGIIASLLIHKLEAHKDHDQRTRMLQWPSSVMSSGNKLRSLALFYLSVVATVYGGIGPTADLHIVNKVISPDGFSRSAVLAGSTATNGDVPGPLITANKGDTFNLNVIDSLTDSTMLRATSIHWHGFFQAGSSWADGPVGVTQCPISPGHSFLYTFSTINVP